MRFERAHDRRAARTGHEIAALIDIDPDLGRWVAPRRWASARRELVVRIVVLEHGPWLADRIDAGHLGVLVVDGILGRELLADDVASLELLGAGDVVRPWDEAADFELLEAVVRWSALARTRLALLDRRLAHYPEIHAALLKRMAVRSRRLAVLQAIAQLTRVERRLLTLFWHLAERWGHVTPDGVLLPLTLSHRMLGQLVGARRPTVSTAIGSLARAGEVTREIDGGWLLTGSPVGIPNARISRFVPPRRATLPAHADVLAR